MAIRQIAKVSGKYEENWLVTVAEWYEQVSVEHLTAKQAKEALTRIGSELHTSIERTPEEPRTLTDAIQETRAAAIANDPDDGGIDPFGSPPPDDPEYA